MPILDLPSPTPAPGRRRGAKPREPAAPGFFSSQVSQARRFYLNLDPPAGEPLVVVSGGFERCDPDYRINRDDFPYWSVEFVAAGHGWLTLSGTRRPLTPGAVFAYAPGIPHQIENDPQRPLEKYFVDFVGTRSAELLTAPAPGELRQTFAPETLMPLFDQLIATSLRSTPHQLRQCVLLLELILLRLGEASSPAGSVDTQAFGTYQRCRRLIEQHHLALTDLAGIAQLAQLDAAYICRLFARFGHESPYQFLTRLRMQHAAQRLQEPGVLVKQVADELAFSDPFHFSRTFRRVLGVSPRRFAQTQRRTQ